VAGAPFFLNCCACRLKVLGFDEEVRECWVVAVMYGCKQGSQLVITQGLTSFKDSPSYCTSCHVLSVSRLRSVKSQWEVVRSDLQSHVSTLWGRRWIKTGCFGAVVRDFPASTLLLLSLSFSLSLCLLHTRAHLHAQTDGAASCTLFQWAA